ncbi:site-2 protease family protein [Lederbergia sp. NSJ-179]|uniref:site-2 protease family protein n=1 Tax=Lederbergia sp. NSJ-179 TaxID=2931402 RepID=UPI001FD47514|nr:site-2 protease family protein [Lederbergia sp. NSJ-179]MCJ7839906.1 site-2 protease family protein [Lederbergia sp. NSJ-179]
MNKYGRLLTKIRVHPLLWVVSGLSMMTGYFWELLALFTIVLIHELGHAVVAQFFNWKIKKVMILPFGGFCDVDEHGNRRMIEDFWVIIGGPVQHLWIAAVIPALHTFGLLSADYAQQIVQYNWMILMFNLLPIRPLDGGKLVHLYLSTYQSYLDSFRMSVIISFVILMIFHFLVFFIHPLNINIWIILIYLDVCLWTEWKQQRYMLMRFLLERHYGDQQSFSRLQTIQAHSQDYVFEVLSKFKRGYKHMIDLDGMDGEMTLDENEILYAYFTEKKVRARLMDLVYVS